MPSFLFQSAVLGRGRTAPLASLAAATALLATPISVSAQDATADSGAEVEAILGEMEAGETESGTLTIAREAVSAGNWTSALSILERFLYADRNSVSVRADYAQGLCVLGDLQSGEVELAKLAELSVDAETTAPAQGRLRDDPRRCPAILAE